MPPAPRPDRTPFDAGTSGGPPLTPIVTLVLWLGCLVIGVLGFVLPYLRPQPAAAMEPLRVEVLNIELADVTAPPDNPPPAEPVADVASPPPPDAFVPPSMAEPIAVAQPSPAIAFAVPVEGPVRVVDAARAEYAVSASNQTAAAVTQPAPQPLSFGRGQGRRLRRPDYPIRARREGQEGTVVLRFRVGENRRVLTVNVHAASPWPLLDGSAERAAREFWHGILEPGFYEIAVQFELNR